MKKPSPWRIRKDTDGVEFVCQSWCPRLIDAEHVWQYRATPKGPGPMREHLQRPEFKDGHHGLSRLRPCPTCIVAVLDGEEPEPVLCGEPFLGADRVALMQALAEGEIELPLSDAEAARLGVKLP